MIDKELLKQLRIELNVAIADVAKKHKISLKIGNARYTSNNFTFKLEGALLTEDGKVVDKSRTDYKTYCEMYGMKPEWLDKSFITLDRDEYKIVELNSRARKNPIIAENVNTKKRYIFTSQKVKKLMGE